MSMSDLEQARKMHQSSVSEAEKIYTDDFFGEQFRQVEELRRARDQKIQEVIAAANAEFDEKIKNLESQTGLFMTLTRSN